jgi:Protein of unknown function (DUF3011)
MPSDLFYRAVAPLVCLSLVAGPLPAQAEETIRCTSHRFGYNYCRVDTGDRVEVVNQRSMVRCEQHRSWGHDRNGVWVDHGCDADFRVGRGDHDHRNKAVAGVALVGLAALLAMSASKQKQAQAQDEVAPWAVGAFTGYDELERADVQLSIQPGGSLTGRAGQNDFTGSLRDNRLQAGRHVFQVVRSGNGFVATDERNDRHRVVFQRAGTGY